MKTDPREEKPQKIQSLEFKNVEENAFFSFDEDVAPNSRAISKK